jgi:hypothetical protein
MTLLKLGPLWISLPGNQIVQRKLSGKLLCQISTISVGPEKIEGKAPVSNFDDICRPRKN